TSGPDPVLVAVEGSGDRYAVVPGSARVARHPLVEAAIDEFPPPRDVAIEMSVRSAVPAGCGAGTSAAVAVAVLGALGAVRGERFRRDWVEGQWGRRRRRFGHDPERHP